LWKILCGANRQPSQTRFKEHKRDFHIKYKMSLYAKHLIEHQYTLYPIEKCLAILHHQIKSRKLNTLEQFHIYKATKPGNKLNDQYTDRYNAIFERVLNTYTPNSPLPSAQPPT
jgi:hypothetical protein